MSPNYGSEAASSEEYWDASCYNFTRIFYWNRLKTIEKGRKIYVAFVDLEQASDQLNWLMLIEVLENKGVEWKDWILKRNVYLKQRVTVNVE